MAYGQYRPANVIFPEHFLPGRGQVRDIGKFMEERLVIKIVTAIDEYPALRQVEDEVATPAIVVEHLAVDRFRMRSQIIHRCDRKPTPPNFRHDNWLTANQHW